jgi:hypothetical protein
MDLKIKLKRPHDEQIKFIQSPAKRKIIRAGRRSGKTIGAAIIAVQEFLDKRRILYASPTNEQIGRFWKTVTSALDEPIQKKIFYKNETEHIIEIPKTETRIKAKTAWNADTLRGDYADVLILDEWQLMDEDAWELVGAPMLLDNNGDAVFIYTPPSLHSRSVSKARDPQHAAKMFAQAEQDMSGRWKTFHFSSHKNPYINKDALFDITKDMTTLSYRMEIMAEDVTEAPGALWNRDIIEKARVIKAPDSLSRLVIGVDPSATSEGDMAGVVGVGMVGEDAYVLCDRSIQGSPLVWAREAVIAYHTLKADRIIAEANQGGEMVALTIAQVDSNVPVELVHASRGKQTRAEPIAARYEQGRIHHVGKFEALEDEMCLWIPGDASPNRMDALVWGLTSLLFSGTPGIAIVDRNYRPVGERPTQEQRMTAFFRGD